MKMTLVYRTIIALALPLLFISCHSKTKEECLNEAKSLINSGNPSGAIALLKSALEKDQNFFEARYQLGKAYAATGKYEQSEKEFQKLLRVNPSRPDLHLELAKVYILSNKGDEAIGAAKRYRESQQDTPEALELLGYGYALKGDNDAAEQYFNQALKSDPARLSAKLGLAGVYIGRGEEQNAKSLLNEVIQKEGKNVKAYYMLAGLEASSRNSDRAIQLYKKIAEINSSDSEALYRAGLLHIDKGEFDKAIEIASGLEKKFSERSNGNTLRGIAYVYKRNFNDAINEFQKALKIQPNPAALYFMGLCYYNKGELELALTQFQSILKYIPSFSQARLFSGIVLLKQQRFDNAISEIKKVLETDANNAIAYNILGSAYIAKGMYDEAIRELNTAIELDPKLIDAHLKKGLFSIGMGNMKSAESELKTAVKIAPEILNSRLVLASYYMRQKNYAKAVSTLKEGLTGKKTDALLYNHMATALFKENNIAQALTYLEKAKGTDPDYFAPYFNLAVYHTAKGDYGKALGEYGAVLKRDPKNAAAMIYSASVLELQGKSGEALGYYMKAKDTRTPSAFFALANYYVRKKEADKAIGTLDDLLKMNPGTVEALEAKGRIYLGLKKYSDALSAFERLEAKKPDQGLALVTNTYIAMRDYKAAIKKLEGKLGTDPQRVELRAEIARIYALAGDYKNAVENAERIIRERPRSSLGYTVLASVYERQNRLDNAIDTLKKGVQADGGNIQASMSLGNLYAKKKDYASSMKTFEGVAKGNPRFVQAVFAQGAVYEMTGKKKDAARKYQEVLEKSENNVPALNNLAYLYLQGYGSKEDALRLSVKAYNLAPNDAGVIDTLGYALLQNERKDDALKALKSAAEILTSSPTVRYHLALAYKANGNIPLAIESLRQALKAGDFPEAKEASLLLAQLSRTKGPK